MKGLFNDSAFEEDMLGFIFMGTAEVALKRIFVVPQVGVYDSAVSVDGHFRAKAAVLCGEGIADITEESVPDCGGGFGFEFD